MKKLAVVLALIGVSFFTSAATFAAEEDCTAEEKWNEDTQKCEPASGD